MRTYHYTKLLEKETAGTRRTTEEAPKVVVPEGSFDKEAYEWNNALLIAAERIWR